MSIAARRLMRVIQTADNPIPPGKAIFKQGWVDDGPLAAAYPATTSMIRNPNSTDYKWAYDTAGMRHSVLNVGLHELVTVAGSGATSYNAGSIESRIAPVTNWNAANPSKKITVHLRLHVGERAPAMWDTLCGTARIIDTKFSKNSLVPLWWNSTYRTLYNNAMVALGPVVDSIAVIGTVNAPGASPFYPEPCLFFFNDSANRDSLIGSGWTKEAHESFQQWFPTTASAFKRVGVEVALNPYQDMDNSGNLTTSNTTVYKSIANSLMSTVGKRAVLSNYSMRTDYMTGSGNYQQMYTWLKNQYLNHKAWFGVQMARPQNVAPDSNTVQRWDDVANWCANFGMNFVETTGKGNGEGLKNVWPGSYNDDSGDVALFTSIGADLSANTAP